MEKKAKKKVKKLNDPIPRVKKPDLVLTVDDRRWRQNLVLRDQNVKMQAQKALEEINKEAGELMAALSAREGVDLRLYEINWDNGHANLPEPKPEAVTDEKAK